MGIDRTKPIHKEGTLENKLMSIFDDIKKIFSKTQTQIRKKQAPVTVYNNVGYSTPKRDSYIDYAQEGYQENAVVYKCINEISNGASSVHLKVFDEDIELDNHPLINLLKRPPPDFIFFIRRK